MFWWLFLLPRPHDFQPIVVVCKCRAAAIFKQLASSAVACAADRTGGINKWHACHAWHMATLKCQPILFMTAAMTSFRLKYLVFLIGRSVTTVWWPWNFVVLGYKAGVWTEKLTSAYAVNGAGTALWLFAVDTSMRARRFGVRIPAGHEIFLFSTTSVLALGPAQPTIIVWLLLLLLLLLLLCVAGKEVIYQVCREHCRICSRFPVLLSGVVCPVHCFVECSANISRFLIQVRSLLIWSPGFFICRSCEAWAGIA